MEESRRLLSAVKRELKARGLTYRDVARRLGLSESSVKRLLSTGRLTLARLAELARLLDMTLAELFQAAEQSQTRIARLTRAQEAELVRDPKLLLVAVCTLNHWTPAEIVAAYRLSEAECTQCLVRLDRLGLIALMPGNRVRPNVARDFEWLPDGPLRHFFRSQGRDDFLRSDFTGPGETTGFVHGMLTPAATAQLQGQLNRLRESFAELHRQSLAVPLAERRGMALLLAMRSWEPPAFAALRRKDSYVAGKG
jgi:transcriptional regulator with XRE-family HTH domain